MFNSLFRGNIQGRNHPGRCAFAEPELLTFRKPKHVIQNKNNGHKNSNNNPNYHDDIELYQEISRRNTGWHSTPEQRTLKNSPIDCDGVQLTNAKSHMVHISILWNRESWTIQLKHTFETGQERATVSFSSNTPPWPHQLMVCIRLSERAYFNYLECSYNIWHVYDNKLSIRTRTKVVRGNTSPDPQVSVLIPRPTSNGMERMCQ